MSDRTRKILSLALEKHHEEEDPYHDSDDDRDMDYEPTTPTSDDSSFNGYPGYKEYTPHNSPSLSEDSSMEGEADEPMVESPTHNLTDNQGIFDNSCYEFGPSTGNHQMFQFTGTSGVNEALYPLLTDKLPHDFFLTLIDQKMFDHIVDQTNLFATQCIMKQNDVNKSSRLRAWVPTTRNEIKRLFGLFAYMGLVKMPEISLYWSNSNLYSNKIAQKAMSRNRFELLLSMLHFSDNESNLNNDRLHKIQPLVDMFLENSQMAYTPGPVFCIDESLVPFRGRLTMRQYIPQKAHKYGVKIFKLCVDKGYTWNMRIYAGKEADAGQSVPTKVVMNLSDRLLDAGRTVITDNYYTSLELANKLLDRQTHLLGTLRANRKGNPKEVVQLKLKKGELAIRENNRGISILKWRDQRDVLMLSTKHSDETVLVNKYGKEKIKPKMIIDYNAGKTSIDLSDQFSSYGSCLRKTIKWYRKVALEIILGTAIVNSHILYSEVTSNNISLRLFREEIANYLLSCSDDMEKEQEELINASRLRRHSFNKLPGSSRQGRKYCKGCYQKKLNNEITKNKVRKVTTYCMDCPEQPRFCMECFKSFHKIE